MSTMFDAAGGLEGLTRLAEAWHRRALADPVVGHAFSHGVHPDHTQRLGAYWAEALGGPTAYTDGLGNESDVVRMHSGNGPHAEMDERAIACFDDAVAEIGLSGEVATALHDYFAWSTRTWLTRYEASAAEVPDGLVLPRWGLNGLSG